jgi:hypothetical protein
MKLNYFFISIILISKITLAQSFDDSMKFFPAKVGDMWEYFYYDSPYSDTLQLFSIKDSVDAEGFIHLWQTSGFINPPKPAVLIGSNYYKIDTNGNVEGYWDSYRGILYKLKAQQGDKWVLKAFGPTGFEMIKVDTVYESYLLGIPTQIKKYRRYFTNDSTSNSGLDRIADYLAYNFGIVRVDGLEGLGSVIIKGAVINSILYGDTTMNITSVFDINSSNNLEDFNIPQNFPNPFNSQTTIVFQINKTSEITIEVFDVLGNKIKDIIKSKIYYPGSYHIQWDGTDNHLQTVSSGVFFYQIDNKEKRNLMKMILLK